MTIQNEYITGDSRKYKLLLFSELKQHIRDQNIYDASLITYRIVEDNNQEALFISCVFSGSLLATAEWDIKRNTDSEDSNKLEILYHISEERIKLALEERDHKTEHWFLISNTSQNNSILSPKDVLSDLRDRKGEASGGHNVEVVMKIEKECEYLNKSFYDSRSALVFQNIEERIWDDLTRICFSKERFIYQLNVLSLLIDCMRWDEFVKKVPKGENPRSIRYLELYCLENNKDCREITENLRAIKKLRKQYPVHSGAEEEGRKASKQLGLSEEDTLQQKWYKILVKVKASISGMPRS